MFEPDCGPLSQAEHILKPLLLCLLSHVIAFTNPQVQPENTDLNFDDTQI